MSKRITSITMGLLALMLMLATPSFAQIGPKAIKAKKTTAFEKANLRADFYKQHPALAKAPQIRKQNNNSVLATTNVRILRAKQEAGALKAGDGTDLVGSLIYGGYDPGLYTFQATSGPVPISMVDDPYLAVSGGGVIIDNKLYFASYEVFIIWVFTYHYVYDLTTNTWEVEVSDDDDLSYIASTVAYDETSKLAYGLFYDADGYNLQFCSMDYTTWTKTVIGDGVLQHASEYVAFTFDGNGNLFGCTASGDVYKIDVNTLEETLFTSTGFEVGNYVQAAAANPKTNNLFWAFILDDDTSGIIQVNLETGKSEIAGYFIEPAEFGLLTLMGNNYADGVPGRAVNLKAYVENDAPNDVKASFSLPTKAWDGETDLTGVLEYTIFVNDDVYIKGAGQPGAAIIRNIPNVNTGNTIIKVVVTNAVGDGPAAVTQLWAGPDQPKCPEPATLTIDEAGKATVNWTAVNLEGEHHGYVDTDNVIYKVVRYPDKEVVAEMKGTSFTETIDVSNLRMVSYGITAVNSGAESQEALTNSVKVGSSYTTPAGDDFSDESSLALYTVVDANGDGCTWINYYGIPSAQYHQSNDADDWLITAPIKLEAGKLYLFQCQVGPYSTSYVPERVEVALGKGVEPAALSTQLIDPTDVMDLMDLSAAFSVEEDGEYNIGFHCISDRDMWYLQLFKWSVSAPIDLGAPDVSTNGEIVPTQPGAYTAALKFNAPTKAINGEALTGNLTINIVGEDFEETLTDVAPGAPISIPVEFEESGVYSFTITASNDKGEGLPLKVSKFIGKDTPKDVENIIGYDNFNGSATFTWDKLSEEGLNGGYVDPEDVTYYIYSVDDGYLGDLLAETKDCSYVLTSDAIDNGPMGLLQLVVQAVTDEGESNYSVGAVVGGTPDAIPYNETFAGAGIDNYWWVSTHEGAAWTLSSDDYDATGGCAGYMSSGPGDAYLCTGKISVKGAVNPKLLFSWIALPQKNMKVRVLADRQDGNEPVELKVIDCMDVAEIDWHQEALDLSAFTNDPYVIIMFEALPLESGAIFEFDAVKIYDVYSNDLAIKLSLPKAVNVGDNLSVTLLISNIGENTVPAGDYAVNLYVNGEMYENETETDALEAYNGVTAYGFSIPTTVFFESPTTVKAEVVYNYDLDQQNNVAEGTVNVRQSSLARVNDLTAETGGWPAVLLRWSEPVIEELPSEIITEDFEDQEIFVPLSVGGITETIHTGAFGSWTLYDGNEGIETYGLNGGPQYENNYAPMAYQVMNPEVAGFDLSNESYAAMMSPNSGEQYLMAWNVITDDYGNAIPNDKWLISPLLSGEEQTISFFVSEITDSYGPEIFEVWYSTTDNEVASFEKLSDGKADSMDWTEVTCDLPAGAKYFAIRLVSSDVFAFQIDDITYAAAAARTLSLATEITGYNIYRDGKLIATVDAGVNSYIDVNETDGEHTYYVTVLYGDKESGLSNGATVVTAISELTSDASLQDADITVYATNGAVVASGKGVYNGLAKGVYVIRNNETGLVKGVSKK